VYREYIQTLLFITMELQIQNHKKSEKSGENFVIWGRLSGVFVIITIPLIGIFYIYLIVPKNILMIQVSGKSFSMFFIVF
jgi:hypothetical protein